MAKAVASWGIFRRIAVVLGLLPLLGTSSPGCATPVPVTAEEICDDARRGIALRTQSCTQDVDLANKRYDLAKSNLSCKVNLEQDDAGYGCSSYLLARSCEQVAAFGDDMRSWVAAAECQNTLGAALSTDPNNPTLNQACTGDGSSCACRVLEGAKNEGICAPPTSSEGMLPTCCASDGYPRSGSCTCSAIYCVSNGSEGNRVCQCTTKPVGGGAPSAGCSLLTFPELAKGVCCLALGSQSCSCTDRSSCGSEETQVSSCETSTFCSMAIGVERTQVARCSL